MAVNIIDIPRKFLKVTESACYVGRRAITSNNPWTRFVKAGSPIDQRWVFDLTLPVIKGRCEIAEFEAIWDQGNGQSGFYSAFDSVHKVPACGTGTGLGGAGVPFSDDSTFSDGSMFESGFASCTVGAAGVRGATSITLTGLIASQTLALARGNMFSIVKSGGTVGFLHKVIADASTDSGGSTTVQISPPLREPVAIGQSVRLKEPRGVFQIADAEQVFLNRRYGEYADPVITLVEAPEVFTCSL